MDVSINSTRHHICSSTDAMVRLSHPHLMKHTWHELSIDHLGPCYLIFGKALGEGLDFPIFNANAIVTFVLLVFYGQSGGENNILDITSSDYLPIEDHQVEFVSHFVQCCFLEHWKNTWIWALLVLNTPQIRYWHDYLLNYQFIRASPVSRPIARSFPKELARMPYLHENARLLHAAVVISHFFWRPGSILTLRTGRGKSMEMHNDMRIRQTPIIRLIAK